MAILKGILKDSFAYYVDLEKRLQARLKELPRGSVFRRRIGRKDYYYLNYRQGARVVSRYLGKEPRGVEKEVKERRLIEQQLKDVRENLRMIARLVRQKPRGRSLSKNP